jgi:hypothetical protein
MQGAEHERSRQQYGQAASAPPRSSNHIFQLGETDLTDLQEAGK